MSATAAPSSGGARPRPTAQVANLPALRPLPTAAERAAEAIRDSIFHGRFAPGTALPESALAGALQVSRNTVREAFRTLMHEQLLTYEVHKGVAVRRLSAADVVDIYRLRRLYEVTAVQQLDESSGRGLAVELQAIVEQARRAESVGDLGAVGTADLRFHTRIAAAYGSERLDAAFLRIMTEIRLGFLSIVDLAAFHTEYLVRNEQLCALVSAGAYPAAAASLGEYLDQARDRVAAAVTDERRQ